MKFKVGDKAVYPAHGVAEITGIESKEVAGTSLNFYVLKIVSSGATLMVPTEASERAGMRGLLSEEDISSVFAILRKPGKVSQRTWNRRFREFSEKMRTGSVCDIAEVLRDLWSLQSSKELSYGEKKMLEKAKELIVAEISAAMGSDEASVEVEINQLLMPN